METLMKNALLLILLSALFIGASGCSPNPAAPPAAPAVTEPAPELVTSGQGEEEAQEYAKTVNTIYDDLPGHMGESVTVSGVAVLRDTYGAEEFMVARFEVDCCIEDAAPMGFVTLWKDGKLPAADAWVKVTGTISEQEVTDPDTGTTFKRPYLLAETVEPISPLESKYVFIK